MRAWYNEYDLATGKIMVPIFPTMSRPERVLVTPDGPYTTGFMEPIMSNQGTPASARLQPSELVGRSFDRLAVLAFAGFRGETRHKYWLCLCECGVEQAVRGTKLLNGRARQCGKCNVRDGKKKISLAMRSRGDHAGFNRLFSEYACNARSKGVAFAIGKEEARRLFEADCHYCGAAPVAVRRSQKGHGCYVHNGIDRVSANLGYVAGNVVPCCATCNYAKRRMTVAEFLGWAARVHAHQRRRAAT